MEHSPGFLKLVESVRSQVKDISSEELMQVLRQGQPLPFILVDVREESEWEHSHLPEAIHLSKGIIERDIELRVPDPSTPLVLYCGGGYRSILATVNLQKMGYSAVRSLEGGFRGWVEKKLPLVTRDQDEVLL